GLIHSGIAGRNVSEPILNEAKSNLRIPALRIELYCFLCEWKCLGRLLEDVRQEPCVPVLQRRIHRLFKQCKLKALISAVEISTVDSNLCCLGILAPERICYAVPNICLLELLPMQCLLVDFPGDPLDFVSVSRINPLELLQKKMLGEFHDFHIVCCATVCRGNEVRFVQSGLEIDMLQSNLLAGIAYAPAIDWTCQRNEDEENLSPKVINAHPRVLI